MADERTPLLNNYTGEGGNNDVNIQLSRYDVFAWYIEFKWGANMVLFGQWIFWIEVIYNTALIDQRKVDYTVIEHSNI